MVKLINKLRNLTVLVAIAILGGCASHVNMLPPISKKTVVKPDEGIVTARIINTTSYPLPFNFITISPDNLQTSKKIKMSRLESLRPDSDGGTLFASAVKAGNYSINSIRSFYQRGDYFYSRWLQPETEFGTFKVEPNKVTDLGIIVFYQKPQEDKYYEILAKAPNSNTGDVLKKHFSFYNFDPEETLTWDETGLEDENLDTFASIVQNPIVYSDSHVTDKGEMLILGKLGVISLRDANGEWSQDALDTNIDLTTIAKNRKGDTIVGGVEGQLFFKAKNKDWKSIPTSAKSDILKVAFKDENTIDIFRSEGDQLIVDRGVIVNNQLNIELATTYNFKKAIWKNKTALAAEANNVTSNSAQSPEQKKKKKKKKKYAKSLKRTGHRAVGVSLFELDGKQYLEIKSLRKNISDFWGGYSSILVSYDPETWETQPAKTFNMDFSNTIRSGAKLLGIEEAGFFSFDPAPDFHVFNDESKTWQKISRNVKPCGKFSKKNREKPAKCKALEEQNLEAYQGFNRLGFQFLSSPWFADDNNAFALAKFSRDVSKSEEFDKRVRLIQSKDAGKSWQITKHKLPEKYCANLITKLEDVLVLTCYGATSDIYESKDGGKTWDHVRQQDDF